MYEKERNPTVRKRERMYGKKVTQHVASYDKVVRGLAHKKSPDGGGGCKKGKMAFPVWIRGLLGVVLCVALR
jgi:hypothetical protein